jgi:small GTP-binding protein
VFGSSRVGKTCLIKRYIQGLFNEYHLLTIEDHYSKDIVLHKIDFTLKIIDSGGSNQFPAIQRDYIQKGDAFILVYSIIDSKSLNDLRMIIKDIIDIKSAGIDKKNVNIPVVLVGSKLDENPNRKVSFVEAEKFAQDFNCGFIEVLLNIWLYG